MLMPTKKAAVETFNAVNSVLQDDDVGVGLELAKVFPTETAWQAGMRTCLWWTSIQLTELHTQDMKM